MLGTVLFAAMALTAQAEAQTGETPQAVAYFEAGVAAYEANNLPLAYQEFLAAVKQGHADASNFSRAFRRPTGCSPGEYRRAHSYH